MSRRNKLAKQARKSSADSLDEVTYEDGKATDELLDQLAGLSKISENAPVVAQDSGLSMSNDGTIRIGGYVLTGNGLVIEEEASESQWSQVGEILMLLEGRIQLLLGDWLVYGETIWGKTYDHVAEMFNREKQTLYDYKWVAERVQFSLRRENLTFSHYKLVAGLAEDERRRWIDHASEGGLSVAELRRAIKSAQTLLESSEEIVEADGSKEFKKRAYKIAQTANTIATAIDQGTEISERQKHALRREVQEAISWLKSVDEWLGN